MASEPNSPNLERYVRQMRFAPIGEEGQRRLAAARALVCGCGALGSVIANTLARSGVGYLRLVDRDFLETNNLQRQVLYDEDDVAAELPKAVAAAARLARVNSQITIDPRVTDLDHTNILELTDDIDVIVDGTDNFETRMLVNDLSLERGIPWIYGGCLGAEGQTMTIVPGETACLRCLMGETPPPGTMPTCDTAGILAPVVNIVASWQAGEAIKLLSGNRQAINRSLLLIDVWENRVRQVKLDAMAGENDCPACQRREFPWLSGERASHSAILCGRNAVQINPHNRSTIALATLADKLRGVGRVTHNQHLLRLNVDEFQLTIFPDGRAIVKGTDDVAAARSIYARYIGA